MKEYDGIYIEGSWRDGETGNWNEIINPATGEAVARVHLAEKVHVDLAVSAAARALHSWSEQSSSTRAGYLRLIAEGMEKRKAELAGMITSEMGMPVQICAPMQVDLGIAALHDYADKAQLMDEPEILGNSRVFKEPIGVCALITPWNFPMGQIIGKLAPALAAGCTVVLKPAELTAASAAIFTSIIHEAGLPPGVFNLLQGKGSVLGAALAQHPKVDMVSFTGSTAVGSEISRLAAPTIKRVCLELGGKSALLITADSAFEEAIAYGIYDVMLNSGQVCMGLTRMLLPQSRYEEGIALAREIAESLIIGDPLNEQTYMGPLCSASQREAVLNYIDKGIVEGARLVTGGPAAPSGLDRGYYVSPTIFADVVGTMTIAQEEIFGPVLCIMSYEDEDDAIAIANSTAYGLSGAVWAKDEDEGMRIARRLKTGQVYVNGGEFNMQAPFGGIKASGIGREWGEQGLFEYVELKSIQL